MAHQEIKVVVGHEPVRYKRYRRKGYSTVRSYRRNFMVIPPEDADTYSNIAEEYSLENQTAKCRTYCEERIAYHKSGQHPIRYIHVTFPNGDVFQWSPARGWIKKEN